MSHIRQTYVWLPAGQLRIVYPDAQRPLRPRKVKWLVANFDPDKVGAIPVCRGLEADTYHIIDGQNRHAAILAMWGPDELVPCLLYETTDRRRAAELFDALNSEHQKPSKLERFKVQVTAGKELPIKVAALLRELGYQVGKGSGNGSFRAIGCAMRVGEKLGVEQLRTALEVIQCVWDRSIDSVEASIVDGFAFFLAGYGSTINRQRLIEQTRKTWPQAGNFVGAIKDTHNRMRSMQKRRHAVALLRGAYIGDAERYWIPDLRPGQREVEGVRTTERGPVRHRTFAHGK